MYVQIGAGAGDLDPRMNCRDGFTELVKSLNKSDVDKVILVEPNPINIPKLRECWKDYPQAEIYDIGVGNTNQTLTYYYAEEDGPHYQVFSMIPEHVLKHYTHLSLSDLKTVDVHTVDISEFLRTKCNGKIKLLAMDIEGIDADILLSVDWSAIDCDKLSFEHLHLGDKIPDIQKHLNNCGYVYTGNGVDVMGYDCMFERVKNV